MHSEVQELFDYGVELLALMISHPTCWPTRDFFHSLFRVLLMTTRSDTGDVAEQLLSKMHIYECLRLPTSNLVTRRTYHYVLLAWLESVKRKAPGAAKRALIILDSMEAQSKPLLSADRKNPAYRHWVAPDRATFELVLQICSSVKIPEEKDEDLMGTEESVTDAV